jgi:hypothetical protein
MDPQPLPQQTVQTTAQQSTPLPPQSASIKKAPIIPLLIIIVVLLVFASAFGGYLVTKQILTSSVTPTPTSTPSPIQDATADWKTYTNSAGYSIKYPPTFSTEVITAGGQAEADISSRNLFVYQSGSSNPYEERYINLETTQLEPSYNQGTISQTTLNGYPAKKIILSGTPFDIYSLTSSQGKFIEIYVSNYSVRKELAYQILSTFKFNNNIQTTTSTTPTPTISNIKKLLYHLPPNWNTVQDATNTFEIGYDPNMSGLVDYTSFGKNQSKSINDLYISLAGKWADNPVRKIGYNIDVGIYPYDGGSRHVFILGKNSSDWDKLTGYHEKEYIYNGWSCLVLYDIVYSQSNAINGMCAISPTQGFKFGLGAGSDEETEKFISTIKLLK